MAGNNNIEEILGFAGDACVHASAGTGKTYLLVEKYIRLLMEEEEEGEYNRLENILAITFTEKAAGEMRARISARLFEEIRKNRDVDGGKIEKNLEAHLRTCRRKMAQAYISTIHSFCARILRENPIEAGIDPQFEIMDAHRTSTLQARALDQFLSMRLREKDPDVIELTYSYGYESDFGFDGSIKKIIRSILPLMRAANMDARDLLMEYDRFMDLLPASLNEKKSVIDVKIASLKTSVTKGKGAEVVDRLKDVVVLLSPAHDPMNFTAVKSACEIASLAKSIRSRNGDVQADKTILEETAREYASMVVSSLAVQNASRVRKVLVDFYNYYERRIKTRALLDFDDLQEQTFYLLSHNQRIRERYQLLFLHVLVDEFQDVNRLQKKIIYLLASPGEGKLFIVGDPKQAIYGFRGGEVAVFNEAKRDITEKSGKVFPLKTNYRSTPGLVKFVNGFFLEHLAEIFGNDDECHAARGKVDLPCVETLLVANEGGKADENRFAEAFMVAERIKRMVNENSITVQEGGKRRKVRYGDMVMLFRKFSQLPIYEAALSNAGVPYMIYQGTGYFQSQEVADLVNVLSVIDDSSDVVAWVGALRSPYVGCSDDTVLKLRRNHEGKLIDPRSYSGSLRNSDIVLEPVEREKFENFMAWMMPLCALKDRITISELIEKVLSGSRITGILGAQPNGLQKVANVLKLMETSRTMEDNLGFTLKNFLSQIRVFLDSNTGEPHAPVAVSDDDVLKIMTIHQSKGLEFPIVFAVDIGSAVWTEYPSVIFNPVRGISAKYVDKASMEGHRGKVYNDLWALNSQKNMDDESRLFYVACTRARERLILSGATTNKGKVFPAKVEAMRSEYPHLFHSLVDETTSEEIREAEPSAYEILKAEVLDRPLMSDKTGYAGEGSAYGEDGEVGDVFLSVSRVVAFQKCRHEYLLSRLYNIQGIRMSRDAKGERDPLNAGSVAHSILESIELGSGKKDFFEEIKKKVHSVGHSLTLKERSEMIRNLSNIYDLPFMQRIRKGTLSPVGREVELTARLRNDGGMFCLDGTIDLLLREGDDRAVIVDYKYSTLKEENRHYLHQLELYAVMVSEFASVSDVSCVLVYLKGKAPHVVEWKLDREKLATAREGLVALMTDMAKWEESCRKVWGGVAEFPLLSPQDCPDSICGFSRFCFPG